jgi:molybdate transport system substrate-binding protein
MPISRITNSSIAIRPLWAFAAAVILTASCGTTDDSGEGVTADEPTEPTSETAADETEVTGTVTVLAAASLTDAFEELAEELRAEHPDLEIVFSFGPSSGLVEQALAGAPGDVLATADTRTMDNAVDGEAIEGDPILFARNTLTLAVPTGNPGGVTGLADLARDDLHIALCEPQVPCGAASEQLLDAAGITASPDTLESDVRDTAGKVSLGEVDAALIYRTDAAAFSDTIDSIDIPEADEVVNDYPVAILASVENAASAEVFIQALTGEPGQRILEEAGFIIP